MNDIFYKMWYTLIVPHKEDMNFLFRKTKALAVETVT